MCVSVNLGIIFEEILGLKRTGERKRVHSEPDTHTHSVTNQVVHRVLWFSLADFNETLCECGHHMTHEIVPQREALGFQHLPLLRLHLSQLGVLCGERGGEGMGGLHSMPE